jgi:hypothetical protein
VHWDLVIQNLNHFSKLVIFDIKLKIINMLSNNILIMPRKQTKEEFIKKSNEKHNYYYDYSKVIYINNSTKIIIICPTHKDFLQNPNNHMRGSGCIKCAKEQQSNRLRKTKEQFILEANLIYNDFFNYEKVIYTSNKQEVIITCPNHGDFSVQPQHHLKNVACKKCRKEHININFIKKVNKIHNNYFSYKNTFYKRNRDKIVITCPKHGDFKQKAQHHLDGYNCPKCSMNMCSKKQIKWLKIKRIVDNTHIQHYLNDTEYYIKQIKRNIDGYSNKLNKIYEFHGDYWHGNPKKYKCDDINPTCKKKYGDLYNNTIKKINKIKNLGYIVEEMWEYEWDLRQKLLKDIRNL